MNKIYDILMEKEKINVEDLESEKEKIFSIIPELKDEDGFDQKNIWHIYDVWKHTEVALSNSNYDYEERLALLLHDIGKPHCFQDEGEVRHFKGHAKKSAEISKSILDRIEDDEDVKNRVLFLIENHSTIIDLEKVNMKNIGLYQKLLNVQYCDTRAYNPEKIEPVIERLDGIKEKINDKENSYLKEENEGKEER